VGDIPETQYARTADGAQIAFQSLDEGPRDLVFVREGNSHLELVWDMPSYDKVFRRFARFSRLLLF